ncbi:MAG TPA: hypothetical protein VFM97_00270 [Gammaproteobacteria bacterium]|nr:hypothetical protein [Gammaproteobacteria bacterium]
MTLYLICSVAVFVACCIAPEVLRRATTDYASEPISTYLTGRYGWIEDAGFLALAAALAVLGTQLRGWAGLCAALGTVGVFGALLTDRCAGWIGPHAHRWHLTCAGLAFVAAFFLEAIASRGGPMIVLAVCYPSIVALVYVLHPKETALQEKVAAALICAWLVAFAL